MENPLSNFVYNITTSEGGTSSNRPKLVVDYTGGSTGGSGGGGSGGTGGSTGGGSSTGGSGGSTSSSTPTPSPTPTPTASSSSASATPTPTKITVTSCSSGIKNLAVAAGVDSAEITATSTVSTRATVYYYGASRTSPADDETKKAKNYDQGTTKVQEDTATKEHKVTVGSLTPSTTYYFTFTLSNGTVECEHKFTTQAPPATPTPSPKPSTKPVPVTSTISGYVYEQGTTTPIPNVTMFLYKRWLFGWRTAGRINTDANGYWQLKYDKGNDYRVGHYLTTKLLGMPDNSPRAGLDFAKSGEACPASETNARFMSWYGDKKLTEVPCENNIFYASKAAQTSGTVVEAKTQKPAPGVVVALRRKELFGLAWRTTAYVTTDAEGKWQFAYLTGYEYQASVSIQDSSAIFPQGRKNTDGTVTLANYKAHGRKALAGCSSSFQDDRTIYWDTTQRLTSEGCNNSTFYVTKRADFKVQTLVDKANAPLANVQLRLLGKLNGIWRGSQDYKKTDENGLVTYSYFPGSTFRVYTYNSVPGYVQGYTLAYPGCPAKTVTTTSRINLVEWSDDKPLPGDGCEPPTRFYMTSNQNIDLGVQISPPGGTFQDKVEVTLSHTPENHIGAQRYNFGPTVTTKSALYRKPILLTKNRKIHTKFFGSESPEGTADFVVNKAAPTPSPTPLPSPSVSPSATSLSVSASPAGGEFDTPVTVTLTASDNAAKIIYTADGSDPTNGGKEYTAPITLSATTLLHFYAQKDSVQSDIGEEEYAFKDAENPVIITWKGGDVPPPYTVLCHDTVIGTTTQSTYTDTNLHYDGCVYKIKSGDNEIVPTKVAFAKMSEGSKSTLPPIEDIVVTSAGALAAIPLAPVAARLPDFLMYGWFSLLMLLGLNKKGSSWARVVSSTTGKPIFGARIAFVDAQNYNRIVARTFSDRQGKFSLPLRPGAYTLRISHPNYVFPSHASQDGYHGEEIKIIENSVLTFEIPMDEGNGGSTLSQLVKAWLFRLASLNTITLILGLGLITYSVVQGITLLNGVLALYYVVFLRNEIRGWKFGRNVVQVKDSHGKPVGLAIVRLMDENGKTVYTRATDAFGRALIDAPKGTYTLNLTAPGQKGSHAVSQPITVTNTPFTTPVSINVS